MPLSLGDGNVKAKKASDELEVSTTAIEGTEDFKEARIVSASCFLTREDSWCQDRG